MVPIAPLQKRQVPQVLPKPTPPTQSSSQVEIASPAPHTEGWTGIGFGADGKFRVDNSALQAAMACSWKAWCRYGLGYTTKGERAELLAGQSAHAALEYHFSSCTGGAELGTTPLQVFDDHYRAWSQSNLAADDKLSFQNTYTIMQRYLEEHPHLGDGKFKGMPQLTIHPERVEVPFEVPLVASENIYLVGKIDLVPDYLNGYAICDHKTTGTINAFFKQRFKRNSQKPAYLWASRQVLDKPVLGFFINAIEFAKLPSDPKRKCGTHNLKYSECREMHAKWELFGPYEVNDFAIDSWLADAQACAIKFRDLVAAAPDLSHAQSIAQEGLFNGGCNFCEFSDPCDMGVRPHLLEANLVLQPWNPLEA